MLCLSQVSNYPRKEFTQQEAAAAGGATLEQSGLVPHAALFVRALDVEIEEEVPAAAPAGGSSVATSVQT